MRRGGMLFELITASIVLAAALAAMLHVAAFTTRFRSDTARRQLALQAASNCLERISGQSWESISTEAAHVALPPELLQELPGGEMKVTIEPQTEPVAAQKIVVEVTWQNPPGNPEPPVRLTTWRYRDADQVALRPAAATDPAPAPAQD